MINIHFANAFQVTSAHIWAAHAYKALLTTLNPRCFFPAHRHPSVGSPEPDVIEMQWLHTSPRGKADLEFSPRILKGFLSS